jgi:hypothetical protein
MLKTNAVFFVKLIILFSFLYLFNLDSGADTYIYKKKFYLDATKHLHENTDGAIAETTKNLIFLNKTGHYNSETFIVPPAGFHSSLTYAGIGHTVSFQRFYEPAEDYFFKLWLYCDPHFSLTEITILHDMLVPTSGKSVSIETIEDCFNSIDAKNLKIIGHRLDAKYALVYKVNFSHLENYLPEIYPSPYMLIKIEDL